MLFKLEVPDGEIFYVHKEKKSVNAGKIKAQKERELAEMVAQKAEELSKETGLKAIDIEVVQIHPIIVRFVVM